MKDPITYDKEILLWELWGPLISYEMGRVLFLCYPKSLLLLLLSHFSRPTLFKPMDCSLPGFSVHGILQVRTLEWVAISFSNAWKWKLKVKSLSLPGSSIHGIFQARVLEWGAIRMWYIRELLSSVLIAIFLITFSQISRILLYNQQILMLK